MRRRHSATIAGTLSAVAFLVANSSVARPPPPLRKTLPGLSQGRVESRWLAPYVLVTTERIGSNATTNVRWFSADGRVVREVSGGSVSAHPGFVSVFADGIATIHAVNGDWKLVLPKKPKKPGRPGFITATADSRTFVHEFHPLNDQIAVDVYVHGKLVNTIGPFRHYRGESVQLGEDGSIAVLVSNSDKNNVARVVVVDPGGNMRFQRQCTGPVHSPVPAPRGTAVLVRPNTGDATANTFIFYDESGGASSFNVGPNAVFVGWVPKTMSALICTSVGYKHRYHLVDCTNGETIWEIPDPNPHQGLSCAAIVVGGYVLFHGYEFAAVDTTDGKVVARWQPCAGRRPIGVNGAWFRKLGNRLFVISDDEFSEFSLEDIAAEKNGWK